LSPVQPSLFLSKYNYSVSVNESFYDKKVGATQTDPDLALRHKEFERESEFHLDITFF